MWNWSSQKIPNAQRIMQTFFNRVAGRDLVDIGSRTYYMPINYITDEKEVIVDENLPIINLKNNNLSLVQEALTRYVEAYFQSEKFWANPIKNLQDNDDKLVHAIATLWLNATSEDYERPIEFINRYTQFIKDTTFDDFCYGKKINKVQTLKNCSIVITREEQEEFQETPDAMLFTIEVQEKDGTISRKKLPRVAYGIADGVAYIYGIQGYHSKEADSTEMKKVNRSRYQVNNMENIQEDYRNVYLKHEPYAYISLFTFLCMLKEKGINKVAMPAFLPLRYEGKELGLLDRMQKLEEAHNKGEISQKEKKEATKKLEIEINNHQRIQYTTTNKFLGYMSRLESDVPGINFCETPIESNFGLVVDISKLTPDKSSNLIFYELSKKIEGIMQKKEEEER